MNLQAKFCFMLLISQPKYNVIIEYMYMVSFRGWVHLCPLAIVLPSLCRYAHYDNPVCRPLKVFQIHLSPPAPSTNFLNETLHVHVGIYGTTLTTYMYSVVYACTLCTCTIHVQCTCRLGSGLYM